MKNILVFLFLCACSRGMAQYTNNAKDLADRAFSNNNFYEAAYYYKKVAEGMKMVGQGNIPYQADTRKKETNSKSANRDYVSYRLAESYRLYENYLEAEGWYYKVVNSGANSAYPLARLWYGVCLRANQHFDEAIKQLELFNSSYTADNKYHILALKEIANCNFAKQQYQFPNLIRVTKLNGRWNSDGSNYALFKTPNNDYWFTSSRAVKNNDPKHLNKIYHAAADSASTPEILKLSFNDTQNEYEYGTPVLNTSGNKLYLTRWFKVGSKTIYCIYYSDLVNGNWLPPQKLNAHVNVDGFNAIQPFITTSGRYLFFASNKPGGQGGYDIWMSTLDGKGVPINSVNLGNTVNTPFDEQAPYYDEAVQRLLYSSKGITGLGGFDFFESFGSQLRWSTPVNLGFPMNSAKDDLYYQPDYQNSKKTFISSDRQSDCCLELFEVLKQTAFIAGNVVDCDTQKPLAGVQISLVDSLSKQVLKKVTLNTASGYHFELANKRPYSLVIQKSGYFTKVIQSTASANYTNDTLFNNDLCLQRFSVGKPVILKEVLYDYGKSQLRPESGTALDAVVKLLQDNPTFKIELSSHTDSIGSTAYNNKLSQDRAQSCVDYITSKGISELRLYPKGYGKSKPIAPNSLPNGQDNPQGRQLNRRTEFTVLKTQ